MTGEKTFPELTCYVCGRVVDIDECEIFECASDGDVRSVECHECTPPDAWDDHAC